MNQIERYIFRRIFLLAIGILVVTTVLAMTTQILLYVNLLTSTGQSIMTYGKLAFMLMPKVMVIVMPFALLISASYTLGGMNEDSELVVIESAGAPPRVIARPVLLIAIGMSVFTLASNHLIEPSANRQVRNIVTSASGDLLSSAIQTGTFTRLDDGVYFNVSDVASGGELRGIFISDTRDKAKSLTYYARAGQLVRRGSDQVLVLQDGQAQNKDNATGKVSIIKFKAYALDLALFPASTHVTHYYPKEDFDRVSVQPGRQRPLLQGPARPLRRTDLQAVQRVDVSAAVRAGGDQLHGQGAFEPYRAHPIRRHGVRRRAVLPGGRLLRGAGIGQQPDLRGADLRGTGLRHRLLCHAHPDGTAGFAAAIVAGRHDRRLAGAFGRGRPARSQDPGKGPLRMIAGTLSRYFFRRQVATILRFLTGILLLVVIVDFTEVSSRLPDDTKFTTLDTLYLSFLRMPSIIETTFPFIILFASMATLIGLNRKNELVVTRSTGVSAWQFLSPLAVASFIVGVLLVTVVNPLAAHSLRLAELQEVAAGLRNSGSVDNVRPPWLRQRTQEGTTIIGAGTVADGGLLLGNAMFLRIDPNGEVLERSDARRARLEHGKWILSDVRTFRAGQPEVDSKHVEVKTNLEPEFVRESLSNPKTVPFFELPHKVDVARSYGLSGNTFAVQFQTLVALPFLFVSMTLIAAVVSLRFARMGQSVSVIVGGIVAGFVLYVVSVLIKSFGGAGIIPPIAAAWIPVVIAMALGVTVLLHKEDG